MRVPDPYYGSMKDFMDVYDLLDKVTDVIIEKIKNGEIR
jgi:protein-tyrosine-phosphatase